MKRGQTEIMGLVMIVILLIGVLVLYFNLKDEDTGIVEVRSNIRANQVRNAILNVNLPDHENKVLKDVLFEACFGASPDTNDCNSNLTMTREILDENIGLREEYYLRAYTDTYSVGEKIGTPCPNEKIAASPAAYRIQGSTMYVDFELCL